MPKTLRSPQHKKLLNWIKALRSQSGLSQAELAAKLGKPQSYVAKIETGERRLDVIELFDLVRETGGDFAELFSGLNEADSIARRSSRRKPKP